MDSSQLLRSPILLDSEPSFDQTRFTEIQSWLNGIMTISEEEQRLQSPICLPEVHDFRTRPMVTYTSPQFSCPPISRKRRSGESRSSQSKRVCTSSTSSSWGLPPQHRFFDKTNWMDEADKQVASMPPEQSSLWRDAYTVMISRPRPRPRRTLKRRQRQLESPQISPYTRITLPVCPFPDRTPRSQSSTQQHAQ